MHHFEVKVAKWLRDEKGLLERWRDHLRFKWYAKSHRRRSVSEVIHWLLKLLIFVSAPLMAHFVYQRISLSEAFFGIAALAILYVITSYFAAKAKGKEPSSFEEAKDRIWVEIGNLITSVNSEATEHDNKYQTINSSLCLIQAYAQIVTCSSFDDVSVSIVLYERHQDPIMKVAYRATSSGKNIGARLRNLDRVMGHRACLAGGEEPRVVGDLKRFGKKAFKSPTKAKCNYRSILLFPLTGETEAYEDMKGFLSVDCSVPHAFHGDRADEIILTCGGLLAHIKHQL